ncbi:MAG: peptidoglycan bridge formation glycyltransferase FemA/FemB family protein [Armatimonadetes bacterium]|nr:peptidoglycan bridge formation glycyltransferase FemA/FemB family protein [Armatimonadota bacterium]
MEFSLLPIDCHDRWNAFVAESPLGDVLQTVEWGEVKRPSGWEALHAAVESEGRLTAAALILKRKISPLGPSVFYCPRGPVLDYGDRETLTTLLQGIRRLARRHRAILLKIDPPVESGHEDVVRTLHQEGFRESPDSQGGFGGTQPRSVMKLDLSKSEEELLAAMKPKTRYNLRLAQRKGVEIVEGRSKQDLKVFYDLLLETAVRDRFRVRSYSYFETIWDKLVTTGLATLFMARVPAEDCAGEGESIAGALSFVLGQSGSCGQCWYVYGASSNRHRNVMPNYLIQWHLIQWAKSLGCKVYDFRGVSPQTEGVATEEHLSGLNRFKTGFGARYVEYIGEFDLPLSRIGYPLWTVAKPWAVKLLKKRGDASAPSSEE